MAKHTLSETMLIEVAYVLHPLMMLSTPEQVLLFLKGLGYNVPAVDLVDSFTQVSTKTEHVIEDVKTLVIADTDEKKTQAVKLLLVSVKEALEELIKLKSTLKLAPGLAADFIENAKLDQLPVRILDFLLFQNLYKRHPKIFGTLYIMGILDEDKLSRVIDIFQTECTLKIVHWEKISRYLSEPGKVLDEQYYWSTDFKSSDFLYRLQVFLKSMGIAGGLYRQTDNVKIALGNSAADFSEVRIPIFSGGVYPNTYSQFGLNISPAEAAPGKKKGLALIPYFYGPALLNFELSEKWDAIFQSSISIDAAIGLIIRHPFSVEFFQNILTPSPQNAASMNSSLTIQQKNPVYQTEEYFLFGEKNNSHLLVSGISIKFFGSKNATTQDAGAEVEIRRINLLITTGNGDSFLNKLLPQSGINADFDLGVGFSLAKGIFFKASACLEILLPSHIQLGPIDIKAIIIAIKPRDGEIPIELSFTINAELGPLKVEVESIGLSSKISFPTNRKGNLGPLNAILDFKPPNGIGLSLDTGILKADGFLKINEEKGEYIGAVAIKIKSIDLRVAAVGIINTKLPGGQEGFSFLIIITAEFPPIPLSFGFTLNGLGGLLGVRRTMYADALRTGIKANTLEGILFPKIDVNHIGTIVSDLQQVFPISTDERFLIGPMIKIGWGTPSIITAEIGVIIELPAPVQIAILGVVRISLPIPEKEIIHLQINFLGIIDFEKKLLSLDAALEDSRILTMTLTGQFALRVGWGDTPVFIFSAGGFHPGFREAPVELQNMQRLGINIIDEANVKLSIDSYFALTTNTVQFGAHAHFWGMAWGYCAVADIGFDTLIMFNPFALTIGLQLYGRVTGPLVDVVVDVKGNLTGPNPWHVWGIAHAKILLLDFVIPFNTTFGEPIEELAPGTIDVLKLLLDEVEKDTNWKADTPVGNNAGITLRNIPDAEIANGIIIHPDTTLSFNQRLVPLELSIDKFGNKLPLNINRFAIKGFTFVDKIINGMPVAGITANIIKLFDSFAPGNFLNIPKQEKLSRPSFETMQSGSAFTIDSKNTVTGNTIAKEIDYEVMYIFNEEKSPQHITPILGDRAMLQLAGGSAAARYRLSAENTRVSYQSPPRITINKPGYEVIDKTTLKAITTENGTTLKPIGSQAEAYKFQEERGIDNTIIKSTFEQ
jgi:hypothetical protein